MSVQLADRVLTELLRRPVCTLIGVARAFRLPLVDLVTPLPPSLQRVSPHQNLTTGQRRRLARWSQTTSGVILLNRHAKE